MTDFLTIIGLILAVSFAFSELFHKIRYPRVIGQIIAGMILGLPIFARLFSGESFINVQFLADLGIVFLLLLTGLELNLEKFRRAERDAIIIAVFSALIPFVLGFVFMKAAGYTTTVAFVVGAALSLTAEGTKLKVLLDMKALNTRVGTIMLGAGILDDIVEILFLAAIIFLVSGDPLGIAFFPIKVILFIILVYMAYKFFPLGFRMVEKERSRVSTFSFILIFGIFVAVLSTKLGLGPVIGAFIAGIIIHLAEHKKGEHYETVKELEVMTFSLIIPFFFINIGLHFDIMSVLENIWLVVMVLVIATIGKLGGSMLATPFTSLNLKQTHLIGWGMNSRGAVELVLAEIARSYNLIGKDVYTAIVTMAILTTLIFPVMMKIIVKKNRKILT